MRPQKGAYSAPTVGVSWGISTGQGALVTHDGSLMCGQGNRTIMRRCQDCGEKRQMSCRIRCRAKSGQSAKPTSMLTDPRQPMRAKENLDWPADSRSHRKRSWLIRKRVGRCRRRRLRVTRNCIGVVVLGAQAFRLTDTGHALMSVFAAIVSARCDDAAPVTTAPREKQAITSLRLPFQRTVRANQRSFVRASQAAFGA